MNHIKKHGMLWGELSVIRTGQKLKNSGKAIPYSLKSCCHLTKPEKLVTMPKPAHTQTA